jgi:citrate lyase subunit beta / citryl-CoA lyase
MLFVPGDRPERVARAWRCQPDAVIVDFEDSVRPEQKQAARDGVADVLRASYPVPLFIRVNSVDSEWFVDDVLFAIDVKATGVMVPKAEDPASVMELCSHLERAETNGALASPSEIVPLIETARGVTRILDILAATVRVRRFMFGAYDYVRDMQVERSADGIELLYPRSALAVAGRAAGCQAIDSPFGILNDEQALKLDCQVGRRVGLTGKGAIHPSQIPIIHELFLPNPAEIAKARRLVDAFDAAGTGAMLVEGELLDKAIVERYRNLLAHTRQVSSRASPDSSPMTATSP